MLQRFLVVMIGIAAAVLGGAVARGASTNSASNSTLTIPNGTILPVRLDSTLSSKSAKADRPIRGRLMQDVLLPGGSKIHAGAVLLGCMVAVVPLARGHAASVSFQFHTIKTARERIPISTSLRAVASFMEVDESQIPDVGPDRGTAPEDRTTNQIGGDVVYRGGGPVESHFGVDVGRPTAQGVLARITANPDRGCPNAPEGEALQSLWVFSSDACGTYGLGATNIARHEQTSPVGGATLTAPDHDVVVRSGAGMLLEVQGAVETRG